MSILHPRNEVCLKSKRRRNYGKKRTTQLLSSHFELGPESSKLEQSTVNLGFRELSQTRFQLELMFNDVFILVKNGR